MLRPMCRVLVTPRDRVKRLLQGLLSCCRGLLGDSQRPLDLLVKSRPEEPQIMALRGGGGGLSKLLDLSELL